MTLSVKMIGATLSRFAVLFPLPTVAAIDEVAQAWQTLLDGVSEAEFMAAGLTLAKSLRRFPYPADVLELIQQARDKVAS